jgi:site-specific DNA recombinase
MEDEVFIFSDEGVSGAILERPQLMASLELLKKGGINYYITMDTSRLSRNVSHQLMLVDEIKRRGAELVFLRNSYQDNPEGRFQITIMAAVDEYERARLKLRTEMGKRAKAKQHLLTHNPGIYGYNFDIKTDCLYINEEQAKIVNQMYSWLIDGDMGPSEISDRLNEIGVPSPPASR